MSIKRLYWSWENGLCLLLLVGFCLISSQSMAEEGLSQEHEIHGFRTVFKFDSAESSALFASDCLSLATEIIQNLIGFQKEILGITFVPGFEFGFIFENRLEAETLNNAILISYHRSDDGQLQQSLALRIKETVLNDGKLTYLSFDTLEPDARLKNTYHIYNFSFDDMGNFLDRMIIKTTLDPSMRSDRPYYKFQEGKWMEYRNYGSNALPDSVTIKTFLLNKDGSKIWMDSKKSFNRRFNDQGQITQETSQITTYSYSGANAGETYAIYNVSLHPGGEIAGYEIVFAEKDDTSSLNQPDHLEINIERNDQGVQIRKTVRKYQIQQEHCVYSEGKIEALLLENGNRVKESKEILFDIKPGTNGSAPEDQILKESLQSWNLEFDATGQVQKKRILTTQYAYPEIEGKKQMVNLFVSLKNIFVTRVDGKLKTIEVNYHDFDANRILTYLRQIKIEVLEHAFTGDPIKLKLQISSPMDPSSNDEEVIIQDCNYIINEAILGELFYQKVNRPFDVGLEEMSEQGEILKVSFYDFTKNEDQKIYTHKETKDLALPLSRD